MDTAAVQQARRFNRTVAERIGALTDRFLGLARPLGESRALWEVGPDGIDVRTLRTRLGLDSGYTSRVLRALERQGLITVSASPDDRRVRRAQLTTAGRQEHAELDRRSDEVAWGFLQVLSDTQRARLVAAMAEVEHLLCASMVRVAIADPASPEAKWCLAQYYAELNVRFEGGFDPAHGLPFPINELVAPAGLLVIAWLREQPIGCGAVKFQPEAPAHVKAPPYVNASAYVKRMWVAPEARGLGVGRRLLRALEGHVRDAGVRVVQLETNRALPEAIRLYRSAGYREVAPFNDEPYGDFWFEKALP